MISLNKSFPYNGVQDYLSAQFDHLDRVISDAEIIAKKAEFRKLYQAWYKANRKDSHIQINISLTKKQYQELIITAKQQQQKYSVFIKQVIFKKQENNPVLIKECRELILNLFDLLEEAIQTKTTNQLSEAITLLETLETKLI